MSSDSKVRVTRLFGGGAAVGAMDPKVGMVTDQGTVLEVSDHVSVSGTDVGVPRDFYAHQLFVSQAEATGSWSYPSGDGAVVFGRAVTWPDGVPDAIDTGMYYNPGHSAPVAFSR